MACMPIIIIFASLQVYFWLTKYNIRILSALYAKPSKIDRFEPALSSRLNSNPGVLRITNSFISCRRQITLSSISPEVARIHVVRTRGLYRRVSNEALLPKHLEKIGMVDSAAWIQCSVINWFGDWSVEFFPKEISLILLYCIYLLNSTIL